MHLFAERSTRSQHNSYSSYGNRSQPSESKSFNSFVRCILPLPPDVRKVKMKNAGSGIVQCHPHGEQIRSTQDAQEVFGVAKLVASPPKLEISNLNTMLIGDYMSVVFPEYHATWLVQAFRNAMFQSVLDMIIKDKLIIDKRYIFLQLGGNQIRSVNKQKVFKDLLEVIWAIRDKNSESRIFVVPVLPRAVANEQVKPLITIFNRWLCNVVEKMSAWFPRIKFLPVQQRFMGPDGPRMQYYNQDDRLTLNEMGARMLKAALFELAGFIQNN